jgi:hypothetical protein
MNWFPQFILNCDSVKNISHLIKYFHFPQIRKEWVRLFPLIIQLTDFIVKVFFFFYFVEDGLMKELLKWFSDFVQSYILLMEK